jgi:hypothetical protein
VTDPKLAFTNTFKDVVAGGDPAALDRIMKNRRSMLDHVESELGRVRCALGLEERYKFDAHLAGVRDLESRLSVPVTPGQTCQAPTVNLANPGLRYGGVDYVDPEFPAKVRAQLDIAAAALACDLTRVIVLGWFAGGLKWDFDGISAPSNHHELSHGAKIAYTIPQDQWFAARYAYLLDQLNRKIDPVNGKPILDSSAVVWTREQADARWHSRNDMLWVIAGGAGGALRTGYARDYWTGQMGPTGGNDTQPGRRGVPHNRLLVTLANAMDVPITSFGLPEFAGPALSELRASSA